MRHPKSKLLNVLLCAAWLAVVAVAVGLAFARWRQAPVTGVIVLVIAAAMLVVFVISFLPKKARHAPMAGSLGRWAVGALLVGAIAALAATLVMGFRKLGVIGVVAVSFFLVTFVRIFLDFIKDARKAERKARRGPPDDPQG